MNRLLLLIVALGLVFGTSSCKTWHRLTGKQKRPAAGDTVSVLPDTSRIGQRTEEFPTTIDSAKQALILQWLPLWDAQTAYSTFSAKGKVDYEGGGEAHEFNVSIRMERDKGIWVSVTALLGIEFARVRITPDTIIAIDRMNKEVRILPFAEADRILPARVDFPTLQQLIIGDVLKTQHPVNELGDTLESVVLRAIDPDFVQEVRFSRGDSLLQSQSVSTAMSMIHALYSDHEIIDGRRFAKARALTMQDKGEEHQLRIEFNRVSFDQPVDLSISIPSKYERR